MGRRGKIALLVFHVRAVERDLLLRRVAAGEQIEIGLAEPVAKQHLRPAVRKDMVGFDEHAALVFPRLKEQKARQRRIQHRHTLARDDLLPVGEARRGCAGEVINREMLFFIGRGILEKSLVRLRDAQTQGGVAAKERRDAFLQQGKVQPAADFHGRADVVDRGTRICLLQAPDIFLAFRKRKALTFLRQRPTPPFTVLYLYLYRI